MLHLLLIIFSYGSLLLLAMPPLSEGVIETAIIFALGLGIIVYKKTYKIAFRKSKQLVLIPFAMLISACSGRVFYKQWLPAPKMKAIAGMLKMQPETMLCIGSVVLSLSSVYFIYRLLQQLIHMMLDTSEQNSFERNIFFSIVTAIATVIFSQGMINVYGVTMGYLKLMWGCLTVLTAILFLYCLFGRILPSLILGAGFFMTISTVNAYIFKFRERLFEPVDIFSVGTAMNVAENYSLVPVPVMVLVGWGLFIAFLIALYFFQRKTKSGLTVNRRLALFFACVICSAAIFSYTSNLKTYHWRSEGARFNGYILDFVSKLKEITVSEPENYDTDLITKLAQNYVSQENDFELEQKRLPHIIVIMDEAFSDLHVIGDFSTDTEVMPFISSLEENTVSGYALASVYGGNTANSEYEFLTGNSLAGMSPNVVPYQQYVRSSTYSMVSYLKSFYNYQCVAMHPFKSSGWNRPAAYAYFGFDECYFMEDFPQKNYVRNYISDQEMFEFLIDTFENRREEPMFIFGVSVQNHGGYTYAGKNYTQSISLMENGNKFPEVEQYLSLIHETDKAVEYLIRYFQNVDEDVVIVFFGDHQPRLSESFYESISEKVTENLDIQQKRYEIPFFIWANYDIEEDHAHLTSLNYLSSYVYDVAGIALPPYNQFLRDMENAIPAINSNGYYSIASGKFLPFDMASGDELRWLDLYKALQYNNIFDKKHQNIELFPVLE